MLIMRLSDDLSNVICVQLGLWYTNHMCLSMTGQMIKRSIRDEYDSMKTIKIVYTVLVFI